MRRLQNDWYLAGCRYRLTPPASATWHSRRRRLSHARCTATSEEEHAVSTGRLGPWRSRAYDTRFATDQGIALGVIIWPRCQASGASRGYEFVVTPTKTPTSPLLPFGWHCFRRSPVYPASSIPAQADSR